MGMMTQEKRLIMDQNLRAIDERSGRGRSECPMASWGDSHWRKLGLRLIFRSRGAGSSFGGRALRAFVSLHLRDATAGTKGCDQALTQAVFAPPRQWHVDRGVETLPILLEPLREDASLPSFPDFGVQLSRQRGFLRQRRWFEPEIKLEVRLAPPHEVPPLDIGRG